jgi:phospholipid/cholesterol/gamma-HCH transport system substrate-binding protein
MMDSKREQAMVGVFVLVAIGLLLVALFSISGIFGRSGNEFHSFFPNAAGINAGTRVRYAGGPPIGRVSAVKADPSGIARMEIDFGVDPSVPVKTDSAVKIASLSPLGDNYLEIVPGTAGAQRAQSGAELPSKPYVGLDELEAQFAQLTPQAQQLLQNLNARVVEMQETLADVNDLLNTRNRQHIAQTLDNLNGMLAENRPTIKDTLNHVNEASIKMAPLLDDLKKTAGQANDAISHLDATLVENRPDLRAAVQKMHETLISASSLTDQLDRMLAADSEDIDEILENMRHVSENMKEFTETIKQRPYTLIRSSSPKPRQPGQPEKDK